MELHGGDNARVQAIVNAALRGQLSEAQAHELQRIGGPEAVLFALLETARKIAELQTHVDQQPSPDPSAPRRPSTLPR